MYIQKGSLGWQRGTYKRLLGYLLVLLLPYERPRCRCRRRRRGLIGLIITRCHHHATTPQLIPIQKPKPRRCPNNKSGHNEVNTVFNRTFYVSGAHIVSQDTHASTPTTFSTYVYAYSSYRGTARWLRSCVSKNDPQKPPVRSHTSKNEWSMLLRLSYCNC